MSTSWQMTTKHLELWIPTCTWTEILPAVMHISVRCVRWRGKGRTGVWRNKERERERERDRLDSSGDLVWGNQSSPWWICNFLENKLFIHCDWNNYIQIRGCRSRITLSKMGLRDGGEAEDLLCKKLHKMTSEEDMAESTEMAERRCRWVQIQNVSVIKSALQQKTIRFLWRVFKTFCSKEY